MTLEREGMFSNRSLLKLIIPLVIEQTLAMLVGMVDGMMVSAAGEAAMSGVSLADMINNLILKLFVALATGGAVVTSQYLGARDREGARRSVGQLIMISSLIGLGFMTVCLLGGSWLLHRLFGSVEQSVMAAGLTYFRITVISYPFIALYNAGAAVFRSVGDSKVSMKVSVIMNIVNLAGNAVGIYILHAGVAGVALPTLLSRIVAAWLIIRRLTFAQEEIRLTRQDLRKIQPDMMRRILKIGIPSACENSIFELGRVLVVSMIALYGTVQTSANAVANVIDTIGVLMGQATGLAVITVVGQCVGARDLKQAVYYTKKLMIWTYVFQGVLNTLIAIFAGPMVGLYQSLSPETVELSILLVRIHTICGIFLWPLAFVLPNALRAANDAKYTMYVGIGSMFSWRITLSFLLCVHLGWGAAGVWIAMVVDWICRSALTVWRFCSGRWKAKCQLVG